MNDELKVGQLRRWRQPYTDESPFLIVIAFKPQKNGALNVCVFTDGRTFPHDASYLLEHSRPL